MLRLTRREAGRSNDANKERLTMLQQQGRDITSSMNSMVDSISPLGPPSDVAKANEILKQRDAAAKAKSDAVVEKSNKFDQDTEAFTSTVLEDARATRERNSKRATIAWWVSSFFFMVGLMISVLGQISGTSQEPFRIEPS